jgi:hypothetical protein
MRLSFDTYWPLLLLGLIPFVWFVQRRTWMDASPKHLGLSAAVRSAVIFALTAALMQPVIHRAGIQFSVAYLLDVSRSVSPSAIQSTIEWIENTNNAGRPSHALFIPFAANSTVFESLEGLKNVAVSATSSEGSIDQTGTHIQGAIERALRSFAPNHLKRIVLISDGNENSGRMTDTIPRLKREGVHVYTVPVATRTNGDAWVEAIMAPAQGKSRSAMVTRYSKASMFSSIPA